MQRFIRFQEALQFEQNKLKELVEKAKKVNSSYQMYLRENPYKEDKNTLEKQRKKITEKILGLIEQGYEKYKP